MNSSRHPAKTFAALLFSLMMTMVFTESAWARHPHKGHNPHGRMGKPREWKAEWTQMFQECFAKHGKQLKDAYDADKIHDRDHYCAVDDKKKIKAEDYWLAIYIALAKEESHFKPDVPGKNGGKTPLGLFQMNSADMARHGCEGRNPTSPKQSICCAIKIGSNGTQKASNKNGDKIVIGHDKGGALGEFYSPLRDGVESDGRGHAFKNAGKKERIKAHANRLCQMGPAHPIVDDDHGTMACRDQVPSLEDILAAGGQT